LEIFDWEALARWAEASLTGVRPLLAVAFALLRDAWAALPRSLLLMEVTSLPAVPVADLLEEVLLWLL
jgi:hypothetical protein